MRKAVSRGAANTMWPAGPTGSAASTSSPEKASRATRPCSRHTESESPNARPWSTTAKRATTPSSTPRPEKRGPHKRRNPRNEGRRQPFGYDKRPPRQNGEVHAGPFRLRSSKPSGLDESVLAVDERAEGQNGQGEMVPGDGVFQENSNKIPRQIRENREIIGFIHPSFANEVFRGFERF